MLPRNVLESKKGKKGGQDWKIGLIQRILREGIVSGGQMTHDLSVRELGSSRRYDILGGMTDYEDRNKASKQRHHELLFICAPKVSKEYHLRSMHQFLIAL